MVDTRHVENRCALSMKRLKLKCINAYMYTYSMVSCISIMYVYNIVGSFSPRASPQTGQVFYHGHKYSRRCLRYYRTHIGTYIVKVGSSRYVDKRFVDETL